MATSEGLRGQGIGTKVLDAVIAHVASHGGGLLWCNARLPAKTFYERLASLFQPWFDAFADYISIRRGWIGDRVLPSGAFGLSLSPGRT
jgi:GNAT superfamily N-acetyltransferase